MSGPSASRGEMPGFPGHRGSASELDDYVLDTLLNGQPLPPDAPLQARVTAEALASLSDPQRPGALTGEAAARSAFARTLASPAASSPATRPRPQRYVRVRPRLAAMLAAAAITLGGTVAAAYADVLPAPIQDLAHLAVGAPAVHHAAPRPHPRRDASLLCTAYQHAQAHGDPAARAAQARKLARAAGGAGKINGYCASLQKPGAAAPSGHHGALGHHTKAHPGHGKTRGKPDPARSRISHPHGKSRIEPKGHQPHAQPRAHAQSKAHAQPKAHVQPDTHQATSRQGLHTGRESGLASRQPSPGRH